MSNSEQNSVFNKELLKAWNIQRQCTMEEFVRRMREEKICPMFNLSGYNSPQLCCGVVH